MRIWTKAIVSRRGWLGLALGLALGMGLPGVGAAEHTDGANQPVFTLPDGSTSDQRGDPWAGMSMQKAVPEPSALLLFAAGAGVVALGARRRS